jgi:hypothetical protein
VNAASKSPVADADGIVCIQEARTALATIRRKKTKPAPERLPWFDPCRGARGPALRSLVLTIKDAVDKHEQTVGDRRRARRLDDQRRYEIAVETVVANPAHSALSPPSTNVWRSSLATRRAASRATTTTPSGSPLRASGSGCASPGTLHA